MRNMEEENEKVGMGVKRKKIREGEEKGKGRRERKSLLKYLVQHKEVEKDRG